MNSPTGKQEHPESTTRRPSTFDKLRAWRANHPIIALTLMIVISPLIIVSNAISILMMLMNPVAWFKPKEHFPTAKFTPASYEDAQRSKELKPDTLQLTWPASRDSARQQGRVGPDADETTKPVRSGSNKLV